MTKAIIVRDCGECPFGENDPASLTFRCAIYKDAEGNDALIGMFQDVVGSRHVPDWCPLDEMRYAVESIKGLEGD